MWLDLTSNVALGGLAGWQADRLACHYGDRSPTKLPKTLAALACALAWGYAAVRWPLPNQYAWMTCLWILVVLADLDLRERWLPDLFTLPLAVGGLLYGTLMGEAAPSVYGLVAGIGFFGVIAGIALLLYRREVFGIGDVKLAAALGAWLTWPDVMTGFAVAFIVGGVVSTIMIIWQIRRGQWRWGTAEIPFGLFLIAGAIALTVWVPPR